MVTIQRSGEPNPVQAVKLSDQVTRALARRIVNGEIGGTAPPPTEQDICREFAVSKTTAREVVRTLVGLGLVEVRHGRRMRVRPVEEWNHLDPLLLELNDDPDVVRRYLADLHDVRMLLEPEIAARAALRASEAQVARMRAIVFHRELAAATDNVVLGFMLDSVRELLRVSRRVTNMTGALAEATQAHRQILDAVAAGEAETARQAMRAHLLTVTGVWAPGEERAELTAAMGRGKARETEAVNV